jgi:hypothetical protein
MVDDVETRKHKPIGPQALWFSGDMIDIAPDQKLVH